MNNKNNSSAKNQKIKKSSEKATSSDIHPAWLNLIQYCKELQYGELTSVQIQNGLPVLAEYVKKKVKFL